MSDFILDPLVLVRFLPHNSLVSVRFASGPSTFSQFLPREPLVSVRFCVRTAKILSDFASGPKGLFMKHITQDALVTVRFRLRNSRLCQVYLRRY